MASALGESRIEDGAVLTRIRVPYADTDQMEHVYYANYLIYFEIGRNEWMRALGMAYSQLEEMGWGVPVAEAHARYKGRVFYDDIIEVKATVTLPTPTRIRFDYEIRRPGEERVLVEGYTIHAVVDMKTAKVCRVPEVLTDLITKMEGE